MVAQVRQVTRQELRRRIGRLMLGRQRFQYGTFTAATASSFTADVIARYPDAFFRGRTVYTITGTGSGQQRAISDSVQATGIATITPNWTVTPDATTTFELWGDYLAPDEVNDAINEAIDRASDLMPVLSTSSSPTVASDRLSVTIPTSLTKITDIRYLQSGVWYTYVPDARDWLDPLDWDTFTIRNGIAYLSRLIPSDVLGSDIHVRGYRNPAQLSSDASLAEVNSDYLVFMSSFLLDVGQAQGRVMDPEEHSGRAANWIREAAMIEARSQVMCLPGTVDIQ